MSASPIAALRQRFRDGLTVPLAEAEAALAKANRNAAHNVYLAQDAEWTRTQATALRRDDLDRQPLWGIPVSLKDCFDLAGFPTSCGSAFYREFHGLAAQDSTVAARVRTAGAVITGKTHLHQLAYGITGQNAEFGDCLQPRDAALLTGGSSSGAAASVQEGSALAAIGTDTGGSIRVPAALCGLSGYRSSITLNTPELWRGGAHLAPAFDTLGWIYSDLRDGPLLAHALLGLPIATAPALATLRIGVPDAAFLYDCEPDVLAALDGWRAHLKRQSVRIEDFDAACWNNAVDLFAPIQAAEAAALHRGHFAHFEPAIAQRLAWGHSLSATKVAGLRREQETFRSSTAALFHRFDYLLLPCAPTSALDAAADHTPTRNRILRYTTPISLCGLPAVALPALHAGAGGLQLIAPPGRDADLLALSAIL